MDPPFVVLASDSATDSSAKKEELVHYCTTVNNRTYAHCVFELPISALGQALALWVPCLAHRGLGTSQAPLVHWGEGGH